MTRAPAPVPRLRRAAKRPRPSFVFRRAAKRPRPSLVSGAQRSVRARPSSPARSEASAPVLRLPSRRRSGPSAGNAAPRRAGPQAPPAEGSSRPGTPRPPSQGKSRKGPQSLPGFRRQAAERTRIIFPGGMYAGENSSQAASVDHGRPRRPWPARSRPVHPFAETGKAGLREGSLAQMFLGTFGRISFRPPTFREAPAAGLRSGPGSCCPGHGSA